MLKPTLRQHFDFSALPSIFVRESFAREEGGVWRVYAGVQNDAWQFDETRWWSERKGAFDGVPLVAPPRVVAAQLNLQGATIETAAMDARGGYNFDPVLRVVSGTSLLAQSSTNYTERTDYQTSQAVQWKLFSAASGDLIAQADSSGVLGLMPDGSYLLWARASKNYGEGQDFYGEWSAIKVCVGAGPFTWNTSVYPGPGSPLYSKIGNGLATVGSELDFVHAFDPLARIVSASCIITHDVRTENGQMDIPANSLLLGGVRASRGGPQTALWLLRENGTARLLAADTTFSDGMCECAKLNHFASDLQQGVDGKIYVLSECDLNVYDPNKSDVFKRLRPFPEETYGHPGGHALRFPVGDLTFWSENLPAVQVAHNDGVNFYNQLVYRTGLVNNGGIGSRWHGTNCAELFRGKLFAVRQDDDTQILDGILAGRWERTSSVTQSGTDRMWQRLRRFGENLLCFGYKAEGEDEVSTLHVTRERSFEEAAFPFFIRRATPAWYDDGAPRMMVAARSAADGIGISNRVVEIIDVTTKICTTYDEVNQRFAFSIAEFTTLGGDVSKLPDYLLFVPKAGLDAGGYWRGIASEPETGDYLTLSVVAGQIRYSGELPYNYHFWGVLCFEIDSDGEVVVVINPSCEGPDCVIDQLNDGTKFRHLRLPVPDSSEPAWSVQITDVNPDKRLQILADEIPLLWLRVDSNAAFDDLDSYTIPAQFGREIFLSEPATRSVDVMMIYPEEVMPCHASVVERRS